jgi:hypothetical protein
MRGGQTKVSFAPRILQALVSPLGGNITVPLTEGLIEADRGR